MRGLRWAHPNEAVNVDHVVRLRVVESKRDDVWHVTITFHMIDGSTVEAVRSAAVPNHWNGHNPDEDIRFRDEMAEAHRWVDSWATMVLDAEPGETY